MAPNPRRIRRWWRLLLVLLWGTALLIALELAGYLGFWWAERENPYIAAYERGEPLPIPKTPPKEMPAVLCPEAPPGAWEPIPASPHNPFALALRVPGASDPGGDARMTAFMRLGDEDRHQLALLNQELVALFREPLGPERLYGYYPLIQALEGIPRGPGGRPRLPGAFQAPWQTLQRMVSATLRGKGPGETTVDIPLPGGALLKCATRCLALPAKDGPPQACLFVQVDMAALFTALAAPLSGDTPWEVPWFRYKPKLRDAYSGMGQAGFSTNNRGYYDDDIVLPKPPGTSRILCIGGSTTEEGTSLQTTYPNILEDLLKKAHPEQNIEVLNCGISGINTGGHAAKLHEYLSFEPDLVIAYVGINDITNTLLELNRGPSAPRLRNALRASRFIRYFLPSLLFPGPAETDAMVHGLSIQPLAAMAQALRARGIPMAICTIAYPDTKALSPEQHRYLDHDARSHWAEPCLRLSTYLRFIQALNRQLTELSHQEGLPLIPTAQSCTGGLSLFGDICHMTPAGISQKAQAIAFCLREPGVPCLHEKRTMGME